MYGRPDNPRACFTSVNYLTLKVDSFYSHRERLGIFSLIVRRRDKKLTCCEKHVACTRWFVVNIVTTLRQKLLLFTT